jgi:hypothetical protein
MKNIQIGMYSRITDVFGKRWCVTSGVRTEHGFNVYLGKQIVRGEEVGSNSYILTTQLAQFLMGHRLGESVALLPISKRPIVLMRQRLDITEPPRATWWAARRNDLLSLAPEAFAKKHGMKVSTIEAYRRALWKELGINQKKPLVRKSNAWWEKRANELMKNTLQEFSDKYGVSQTSASNRRNAFRLGVSFHEYNTGKKMARGEIQPRTIKKFAKIAKDKRHEPVFPHRSAERNICSENWWKQHRNELIACDTANDFAKKYGVSKTAVTKRRQALRLGISYLELNRMKKADSPKTYRNDEVANLYVTDIFGKEWQITHKRKTKHRFNIYIGRPMDSRTCGYAFCLTKPLARYIQTHGVRKADIPMSHGQITRFRKMLGIARRW